MTWLHSTGIGASSEAERPRLLDAVRARVRRLGLAIRTEEAYVGWVRRFILACGERHPSQMGAREVEWFLSRLAGEGGVSASTQNQALAALLFLYREAPGMDLPWMHDIRGRSGRSACRWCSRATRWRVCSGNWMASCG